MMGLGNVLAPQAPASGLGAYLAKLKGDAETQFPYLKQYKLNVVAGKGNDYAETWKPGDAGDLSYPRDPRIPLDQAGVVVMKPQSFGPSDLAAEGLHLDPVSMMIRQRMMASLSPEQTGTIRGTGDYRQSVGQYKMSPDAAMNNGMDSALRSAVFGQAADATPEVMQYTPQQRALLATLRHYVTTGHQ